MFWTTKCCKVLNIKNFKMLQSSKCYKALNITNFLMLKSITFYKVLNVTSNKMLQSTKELSGSKIETFDPVVRFAIFREEDASTTCSCLTDR